MDANFYAQLWPGLLANLIGGVVLTGFFFLLKERLFPLPELTGVWECEQHTVWSAYGPYKGMKVTYQVVLLQGKNSVIGDGEKDREDGANGILNYTGSGRTHIVVKGTVEKLFTKPDRIRIQWTENGQRISSTIHHLQVTKNSKRLSGEFFSTAGRCSGNATWTRVS